MEPTSRSRPKHSLRQLSRRISISTRFNTTFSMYSKRVSQLSHLVFLVGQYLGSTSLSCHRETQLLTDNPHLEAKVNRNFALAAIWDVLAFGIILKYYYGGERDIDNLHMTIAWWLGFNLVLLTFAMSRFLHKQLCQSGNGLTLLLTRICDAHVANPDFQNTNGIFLLLELALAALTFGSYSLVILVAIFLIHDPTGVIFIGALISKQYFIFPIRWIVICFHTYIVAAICSGMACMGGSCAVYLFYFYYIIDRELNVSRKVYIFGQGFRKPEYIRMVYRALQILQNHALISSGLGQVILMFNVLSMSSAIYMSFVLIRFWMSLKWITKAPMLIGDTICIGYWTVFLHLGCLLQVAGSKTMMSWTRHKWGFQEQRKLMKRFRRSCQLIVFCYGHQFVIGRTSVGGFLKGVVRGTFRTLLTTKR